MAIVERIEAMQEYDVYVQAGGELLAVYQAHGRGMDMVTLTSRRDALDLITALQVAAARLWPDGERSE